MTSEGRASATSAAWRFAAGFATGAAHQRRGEAGQDRWACRQYPDGTLVAAVADGAGSALHGGEGAELAVHAVLEAYGQSAEEAMDDRLRAAVLAARAAVLATAAAREQPPRSFASTLLAVVLGPAEGAAAQLGDGAILLGDADDAWDVVCWPQKGEYANTTFFLTDADAPNRLVVKPLPATVTDVALLTDGLEALALHFAEAVVFRPFITRMLAPLRAATPDAAGEVPALSAALAQFLASPAVQARTDDDTTLLLATRYPLP